MHSARIAFIGGGNMARSLIGGLLRQGHDPRALAVSEPMDALRQALVDDFGIDAHVDNAVAAAGAAIWVLAVKPQVLPQVLQALRSIADAQAPLVVSIAAGYPIARMQAELGPRARIVRTMPNTPALIGAGVTGLCAGAGVDAADRAAAESLLAAAGATVWLDQEAQMDVVTALSGSGPAYFFLLMESLIAAGVTQGLAPDVAAKLVLHTALGAARMACEGSEPPELLRARVTSPGGTTAAALASFEAAGFRTHCAEAVAAAVRRGRELAQS